MKLRLKSPPWTEKRDTIRLGLDCPVSGKPFRRTLIGWKRFGNQFSGMVTNPSLYGLRLCIASELQPGTCLRMKVEMETLGFDRPLRLMGTVVWSSYSHKTKSHEHGVRLSFNAADRELWEEFITEQMRSTDREWRGTTFQN